MVLFSGVDGQRYNNNNYYFMHIGIILFYANVEI